MLPQTVPPILGDLATAIGLSEMEDTHGELIGQLAVTTNYDIIQLDPIHDPDVIGLVVNGELRISYRKVDEYVPGSRAAEIILSKIRRQAVGAQTIVRGYGRAVRNAAAPKRSIGPIRASLEQEPTTWDDIVIPEFVAPRSFNGAQSLDIPELEEASFIGLGDFEPLEQMREGFRSMDVHIHNVNNGEVE